MCQFIDEQKKSLMLLKSGMINKHTAHELMIKLLTSIFFN